MAASTSTAVKFAQEEDNVLLRAESLSVRYTTQYEDQSKLVNDLALLWTLLKTRASSTSSR